MSLWTLLVEEKTKGIAGGICEREVSLNHAHPSGHTELDQLQSTSNVPWFTAEGERGMSAVEGDGLRDEVMRLSALLDGVGFCREHFPTVSHGYACCWRCVAERDESATLPYEELVQAARFHRHWLRVSQTLHRDGQDVASALAWKNVVIGRDRVMAALDSLGGRS